MATPDPWLTTERLALRRFTAEDLDWLAALWADADVMRYMGGPERRASAQTMLEERILRYYDEYPGLGIWMTLDRSTGAALGLHLLNHIRGESILQIGFVLDKPAWGRGYGTEMAAALMRYGFVDVRLPRLCAMTHPANLASQHVLLKIGLHRHGERSFPAYAKHGPQAWFEREAADWLAERAISLR